MSSRTLLLGAAALLAVSVGAGSAYAFTEVEIGGFHTACRAGDHDACARRDRAIHDPAHEAEWGTATPTGIAKSDPG
jgi:hypothetical protein